MDTTTATLISEAVVEAIQGPKRVKSDAGEVEQHSLSELIAADRYVRTVIATTPTGTRDPRSGIRFSKQISPGAL